MQSYVNVHLEITVPTSEGFGQKSAAVFFTAEAVSS